MLAIRRITVLLSIINCVVFSVQHKSFAEEVSENGGALAIEVSPAAIVPLGSSDLFPNLYGTIIPGVSLDAILSLSSDPANYYKLSARYELPGILAESTVHIIALQGGLGRRLFDLNKVALGVSVAGGLYLGFADYEAGLAIVKNPSLTTAITALFPIGKGLRLSFKAAWNIYFLFYHSATLSATIGYSIPLEKKPSALRQLNPLSPIELSSGEGSLRIGSMILTKVFPTLYRTYIRNSFGKIELISSDKVDIEHISMTFMVDKYMDRPYMLSVPESVARGRQTDVEINALFNESILDVTEGTEVLGEITVYYSADGQRYVTRQPSVVAIANRNALVWDDDKKVSAFVTAKDPTILQFSRTLVGQPSTVIEIDVDPNLEKAVALHEGLRMQRITYQKDPLTPYELMSNTGNVDYVQFPWQTLANRSGDCDDLSILYCSLFESLGIDSAFITFPGHILMAFALEAAPGEAKWMDLAAFGIVVDDRLWIPVETTLINSSFSEAVKQASISYNKHSASGTLDFFETRTAWTKYPPVGYRSIDNISGLDGIAGMEETVRDQLVNIAHILVDKKITVLKKKLDGADNPSKTHNRIGTTYAQYGLFDDALRHFEISLSLNPSFAANYNLATVHYLRNNYKIALQYFELSLDHEPGNNLALEAIRRIESNDQQTNEKSRASGGIEKEAQASTRADAFLFKEQPTWVESED